MTDPPPQPPPVGANLSVRELLGALRWKLESDDWDRDSGASSRTQETRLPQELLELCSFARQQYNHARRVNCLPHEVLGAIFLIVQVQAEAASNADYLLFPPFPSKHTLSPPTANPYSWLKIVAVCRHWRYTSFKTPELWCHIHLHRKCHRNLDDLYRLFLKRSGGHQIHIQEASRKLCSCQCSLDGPFFDELVQQKHRIATIHLSTSLSICSKILWDSLRLCELPSLRSLKTRFKRAGMTNTDLKSLSHDEVVPFFPKENMPSLQRLVILDAARWADGALPHLTHLILQNCPRPSLPEFIVLLSSSPLLEELYLINAGPHSRPVPSSTSSLMHAQAKLSLTHLRHLEIGKFDETSKPGILLSRLSLPSDCKTVLWSHVMFEEQLIRYLLTPVAEAYSGITSVEILSVTDEVLVQTTDRILIETAIPVRLFLRPLTLVLRHITKLTLRTRVLYPAETGAWSDILSAVPLLRTLCLSVQCESEPLVRCLQSRGRNSEKCENLEEILVENNLVVMNLDWVVRAPFLTRPPPLRYVKVVLEPKRSPERPILRRQWVE